MAILAAVKLAIYNEALRHLGARKLASLTEDREPRRVLDDVWGASDDAVLFGLESGDWNFATRSVSALYDPSITPSFGWRRVFGKPDDFVRLTSLAGDEYFQLPYTARQYADEAGYWLADVDTLYIRYVSSHADFGFDSSKWTIAFRKFLAAYLAHEACERLTNSTAKVEQTRRMMQDALKGAVSRDAMDEGVKFRPAGNWIRSRAGGRGEWT